MTTNKPTKFQQVKLGRNVPLPVLFQNRAVIREQQRARVEPRVVATTSASPWLGPFKPRKF